MIYRRVGKSRSTGYAAYIGPMGVFSRRESARDCIISMFFCLFFFFSMFLPTRVSLIPAEGKSATWTNDPVDLCAKREADRGGWSTRRSVQVIWGFIAEKHGNFTSFPVRRIKICITRRPTALSHLSVEKCKCGSVVFRIVSLPLSFFLFLRPLRIASEGFGVQRESWVVMPRYAGIRREKPFPSLSPLRPSLPFRSTCLRQNQNPAKIRSSNAKSPLLRPHRSPSLSEVSFLRFISRHSMMRVVNTR